MTFHLLRLKILESSLTPLSFFTALNPANTKVCFKIYRGSNCFSPLHCYPLTCQVNITSLLENGNSISLHSHIVSLPLAVSSLNSSQSAFFKPCLIKPFKSLLSHSIKGQFLPRFISPTSPGFPQLLLRLHLPWLPSLPLQSLWCS